MITVRAATVADVGPELTAEIARLLPQLSASAAAPTTDEIGAVVGSGGSVLYLAREPSGELRGMLTLVTYRIPTGLNAVIEDVVVDSAAQRGGVGGALVTAALDEAARRGARHVDLTSRPSREAANQLYLKMGFVVRETNVYRHSGVAP